MNITTTNNLNRYGLILSQIADCTPLVATISNLAKVIFKLVIDITKIQPKNGYFHMISEKSYLELCLKMLPILGQIISFQELVICGIYSSVDVMHNTVIQKLQSKELSLDDVPFICGFDKNFLKKALEHDIDVCTFPGFKMFFETNILFFIECLKIKPSCFSNQTNRNFIDHEEVYSLIESRPELLKFIPSRLFLTRSELLERAIDNLSGDDLYNLINQDCIKSSLINSPDLLSKALDKSYKVLSLIPQDQQTQQQVQVAISLNGLAIEFAAATWRYDQTIIKQALEQNPMALEFIDTRLVSLDLFKQCVKKNPLAWSFGTIEHQADTASRFQAVIANSQADRLLFKRHKGDKIAMIAELASELLQQDFFKVLDIPHPYLFSPQILKIVLNKCPSGDKQLLLNLLQTGLPDSFKYYLKQDNRFLFDAFESSVKATISDPTNMTGACVNFVLKEDQTSILGYSLDPTVRSINTDFIEKQKKVHATNTWAPVNASSWENAFTIMFEYASSVQARNIQRKYHAFFYEESFYASATGELLKLYFRQTKLQLGQLAGYIESLKSESDQREMAIRLIEAFDRCAGGIQAYLSELVETYCTFSGNPPLEYRLGKLIQKFAARCIQYCAHKYRQSTEVHTINSLAYYFNNFYLDPQVEDLYAARGGLSDLELTGFFEVFNAQTLLEEVYEEAKNSSAFKEALFVYVRSHPQQFMPDVSKQQQDRQESFDTISEQMKILKAKLDRYNDFLAFLATQPENYRAIMAEKIIQPGHNTLVKTLLKRELQNRNCNDATINTLLGKFDEFRADIQSFNLALISIKTELNLDKNLILVMLKDGRLNGDIESIMTSYWEPAYQALVAESFLHDGSDESGHLKKETLVKIFDKAGVFIDPFAPSPSSSSLSLSFLGSVVNMVLPRF